MFRAASVRSALITTIVTAGLLAPVAAQAKPIDRTPKAGGSTTIEVTEGSHPSCAFLKQESSDASNAAADAYAAGDRARGKHFSHVADADYQEAHDMGCGWVA